MAALTSLITQTTQNPQTTDVATFGGLGDCKITSGVIAPVTPSTTSGVVSTTTFTLTDNSSLTEALTARWTFGTMTVGSTIRLIYSYLDANNYYFIEVKKAAISLSANALDVRDRVTLWKRVAGVETEITSGFFSSKPWSTYPLYRQVATGDLRLEKILSGTTIRATHCETQHFIEVDDVPFIHVADSALNDGGKVGYSFIGSAHTNTLTNLQAQKMKVYWTASTGNDSNTGSRSAPFLLLSKASSVVNVNEMVLCRSANYSSKMIISRVAATSREEGPMMVVYKGESVTYNPPGPDSTFITLTSTSCKFWKFHGFTYNGGTGKGKNAFNPLNGATNMTMTGWHITGSGDSSILLSPNGADYTGGDIVRDNIILRPGDSTFDHGAYVDRRSSDLAYNWLDGENVSLGYGLHFFGGSSPNSTDNCTSRWNRVRRFTSSASAGIILSRGNGLISRGDMVSECYDGMRLAHEADECIVEYGVFYDNTQHGIHMGPFDATDNLVANCTVTGNGQYGVFGYTLNVGGLVKNTIAYNNTVGQIGGTNITETTNLKTNPSFVDAANKDFHLLDSSAAIEAGTDLSSSIGVLDFDGRVVPQNTLWPIGAFSETVPPDNPPVLSGDSDYVATAGIDKNITDWRVSDPEGDVTYVDFVIDNVTTTLDSTNSNTAVWEGVT